MTIEGLWSAARVAKARIRLLSSVGRVDVGLLDW